jgi:hypothetical protein
VGRCNFGEETVLELVFSLLKINRLRLVAFGVSQQPRHKYPLMTDGKTRGLGNFHSQRYSFWVYRLPRVQVRHASPGGEYLSVSAIAGVGLL